MEQRGCDQSPVHAEAPGMTSWLKAKKTKLYTPKTDLCQWNKTSSRSPGFGWVLKWFSLYNNVGQSLALLSGFPHCFQTQFQISFTSHRAERSWITEYWILCEYCEYIVNIDPTSVRRHPWYSGKCFPAFCLHYITAEPPRGWLIVSVKLQ